MNSALQDQKQPHTFQTRGAEAPACPSTHDTHAGQAPFSTVRTENGTNAPQLVSHSTKFIGNIDPYSIQPAFMGIQTLHSEPTLYVLLPGHNTTHAFTAPYPLLIEQISRLLQYPPFSASQTVPVNLLTPFTLPNGQWSAESVVVFPEWRVDVTRICQHLSTSFTGMESAAIRRYLPVTPSVHLVLGQICNTIMAHLIHHPELPFQILLSDIFTTYGLNLTPYTDDEIASLINTLRLYYSHLQQCIREELPTLSVRPQYILAEPSYFCDLLGLQGRPDFIYPSMDAYGTVILELKSGKPGTNNQNACKPAHQLQASLYRWMISRSLHPKNIENDAVIYAATSPKRLFPCVPDYSLVREAIQIRNDCTCADIIMTNKDGHRILLTFPQHLTITDMQPYTQKEIRHFTSLLSHLTPIEQSFWHTFGAAIHHEQLLTKLGGSPQYTVEQTQRGQTADIRITESGRTIGPLQIKSTPGKSDFTCLECLPPEGQVIQSCFRKGDLAILYPRYPDNVRDARQAPSFRCTIREVSPYRIVIALRTPQPYTGYFLEPVEWILEADTLDSSFRQMYQGLSDFLLAEPGYRELYLGLRPPEKPDDSPAPTFRNVLSPNQQHIVHKALQAKDYYIIWGPPGTGKTSRILNEIAWQLYSGTSDTIAILAFTNRAVDEICESLAAIDPALLSSLCRIGSSTATAEPFQSLLLDPMLRECKTRKDIKNLLMTKRIYVGTVASLFHKRELFSLLTWHTVIIDEASQLTEPMLAGLLTQFRRWILIGDHMQLPAVTSIPAEQQKITDPLLINAGFKGTHTSVFERLFSTCQQHNWTHCTGILTEHGRLHASLLSFPNEHFYQSCLTIAPGLCRQTNPTPFAILPKWANKWNERKLLIHVDPDHHTTTQKASHKECEACMHCISILDNLLSLNHQTISLHSIGIITPFRDQASLLQQKIAAGRPDIASFITIDTIERYQGSTKDSIILSFGLQHVSLLETMISLSPQGIDRKLNVALTRAKERIIIVGNSNILRTNKTYLKLLNEYIPVSLDELQSMNGGLQATEGEPV